MKSYQRLFAELKCRHVFRIMAVYGIAALVAGAWWVGRQSAPVGITEGHATAPSAIEFEQALEHPARSYGRCS